MSHAAIRDVSDTLHRLLEVNLPAAYTIMATSPQRVTLTTDHALNLYLYLVVENAFAKNKPPLHIAARQSKKPPLGLNLYYMLTPYIRDDAANTDDHLILGQAMQVLYDNPVVTDPDLQGDLRESGIELHVVLCRLNLEEQTRIWNALQIPYRLSVCYEVRTVLVDSTLVSDMSRVEIVETRYDQL